MAALTEQRAGHRSGDQELTQQAAAWLLKRESWSLPAAANQAPAPAGRFRPRATAGAELDDHSSSGSSGGNPAAQGRSLSWPVLRPYRPVCPEQRPWLPDREVPGGNKRRSLPSPGSLLALWQRLQQRHDPGRRARPPPGGCDGGAGGGIRHRFVRMAMATVAVECRGASAVVLLQRRSFRATPRGRSGVAFAAESPR